MNARLRTLRPARRTPSVTGRLSEKPGADAPYATAETGTAAVMADRVWRRSRFGFT